MIKLMSNYMSEVNRNENFPDCENDCKMQNGDIGNNRNGLR